MGKAMALIDTSFGSTDASYRAWGSSVSSLLTSAGLTKTQDTGQIDWATVSRPTTSNAVVGYEIRSIPWTLGTIYLKMEYCTTLTTGGTWCFAYTIGTGTNGAGTITGTIYKTRSLAANSNNGWSTSSIYPWYAATWNGGFGFFPQPARDVVYHRGAVFDMTCTSAGTMDDEGAFFAELTYNHLTSPYANNYPYGYSKQLGREIAMGYWPAKINYPFGAMLPTTVKNGTRPIAIHRHATPKPRYHKNLAIGWANDFPVGVEIDATVLGSSIHYISMGLYVYDLNGIPGRLSDTTAAILMRWEA